MQIRKSLMVPLALLMTLSMTGHSGAQEPPLNQTNVVAGLTVRTVQYGACIVVGANCVPASGYAAAYAKAVADKLDESAKQQATMTKSLTDLSATMQQMQKSFSEHVVASDRDLRQTIAKRFDALPAELLKSTAIAELRKSILSEVDAKIAALEKK